MVDFKAQQPGHSTLSLLAEASPCPSHGQQNAAHVQLLPTAGWCKGKGLARQGGLQHLCALPAIDWILVQKKENPGGNMSVRERMGQGCQQGTEGIKLTLVGNNLKGQEVTLTFEITNKSLEPSMLSIFCHPPDVPLYSETGSILTAVLSSWSLALEMGITSAGLSMNCPGSDAALAAEGQGWPA